MEKARQHGKSTATWKKHRNMTKATQHVTSTVTIYKHCTKTTKNGPPRWGSMKRQQAWMHDGSNNDYQLPMSKHHAYWGEHDIQIVSKIEHVK